MKVDREKLVKVIGEKGRFFKNEYGKGWGLSVRGLIFKHYEVYWPLGSDMSIQDELYVTVEGVDCHLKIRKNEDEFNLCWDIISTYGEFLEEMRKVITVFGNLHKACCDLEVTR